MYLGSHETIWLYYLLYLFSIVDQSAKELSTISASVSVCHLSYDKTYRHTSIFSDVIKYS